MIWLVAAAGGLGAVVRFVVDALLMAQVKRYPAATFFINVTGSFALGLVTGLAGRAMDPAAASVLGTGFLGGYTTFSSAMWEAAALVRDGRRLATLTHTLGMLAACAVAAGAGLTLAA